MSDSYLAICKYNNKTTSVKFSFMAADSADALVEMRKASGVRNIGDLYEYTLMRVVSGGYVVVSERYADKKQPAIIIPPPVQEASYTPYTKAAA
ncbi:hypothetical protein [Xanthomonas phage DES1]|nr:hypothetical protein [Xanthomonas phage DES1]